MRSTHRSATRFLHHRGDVDSDAEASQPLDDVLRSHLARVAEPGELDLELVGLRHMQCKEVNLARTVVRAQLDTRHDPDTERISRELCLLKSGERVVIGESDCRQSCGSRGIDYRRRSERAVGRGRVHVQIDLAGPPFGLPRGDHFL